MTRPVRQARPRVASDARARRSMSARPSMACLRQIDFLDSELAHVDREIAAAALARAEIERLMTIPGVDVTTAATLIAAIGDISRFPTPRHLVGYLGLDPKRAPVRQTRRPVTGASPRGLRRRAARARRGRLVGGQGPGPLRAFDQRVARPPRRADRRRRRRAQAGRARLAPAHPRAGLRLPAPHPRRAASCARSSSRPARRARKPGPKRTPIGQPAPKHDAERATHRTGRARLPPARRRLASHAARREGAGATPGRASQRPSKRQAARQATSPRRLRFSSSVTRTHPQPATRRPQRARNLTFIRKTLLGWHENSSRLTVVSCC